MAIKDILIFLRVGEACDSRLALAATLARRHGAALTGLCPASEPEVAIADGWAIGPQAIGEVLAHREADIDEAVATTLTAFQAVCSRHAIACRWLLPGPSERPQNLALAARCYDLAIVGRAKSGDREGRSLAELVALTSGAPCLIVREGSAGPGSFDRILLAWNGSRQARRALGDGMVFLEQARSVRLVTVGDEPGQSGVAEVLRHLAAHGVEAEFERVGADVEAGAALLDRCRHFGADLMIMGAYAHSPVAELVLGGATRTVLGTASLPVLMAH